jgi:succinate dehydrogenase/fumarate reductase flavoprotein subunit
MISATEIPVMNTDVLVIGGGTAGPMAAVTAKEANPSLEVLLLEKANVKRSGAISTGMDGLNNAIIPGHPTPENYVKEITIANDGIVNQKALLAYAQRSYPMIQKLDDWGVHFQKGETGDYDVTLCRCCLRRSRSRRPQARLLGARQAPTRRKRE